MKTSDKTLVKPRFTCCFFICWLVSLGQGEIRFNMTIASSKSIFLVKADAKMPLKSLFFCYYFLIALPFYPIILYLKIQRNWCDSTNEALSELVQRMLDFSRHVTVLRTGTWQLVTADSIFDRRNAASLSCHYHTLTQLISGEHPVYSLCRELLNIHHSLFGLFIQTWTIIHSVEKAV